MSLVAIARELSAELARLEFSPPVAAVYNPLEYALEPFRQYAERFGRGPKEVVFLGMNPGPWGMAQTGVPFGEIAAVRDWMGIRGEVGKPSREHPKRPVEGFACTKSEVSGRRLWGWAAAAHPRPEGFFGRFFVANYCPLAFMEDSGRNRVPEKLPAQEREPLFAACDRALGRTFEALAPDWVIGIGTFAEDRAKRILGEDSGVRIGRILHPSPASPAANRGWAEQATAQLRNLGITL